MTGPGPPDGPDAGFIVAVLGGFSLLWGRTRTGDPVTSTPAVAPPGRCTRATWCCAWRSILQTKMRPGSKQRDNSGR
jgi:hypothetical protein